MSISGPELSVGAGDRSEGPQTGGAARGGVKGRVRVPRARVFGCQPIGGQEHTPPRSLRDPLPDLDAMLARLLAMPVDEIVLLQPGGADLSRDKIGCAELYVSLMNDGWGDIALWSLWLINRLIGSGRRVVVYDGVPRTDADETLLVALMRTLPDGVVYCMDEAGSLGPDSRAHRLAERLGGPERFAIEALPKRGNEGTWDRYRVFQLAREQLYIDRHPDEFVDPALHPEVNVIMSGHTLREIRRDADQRDAAKWITERANTRIGWMPWQNEQYAGRVFEVEGDVDE